MIKKIKDIGETKLIEYIKQSVKTNERVLYGIGDDTAVLSYNEDKYLLFTSDMLVEGVHFKKGTDFIKVGHKALACSLSDIAAMGGGRPLFALISLGISRDTPLYSIKRLYRGMDNLSKEFSVSIVGGDTNRSKYTIIDVSVLGEIKKKNLLLRSTAKKNDFIFVTGKLGGSFKSGRHLSFIPRLKEAEFLTRNLKINSMIDISDGLAADLLRLASSSNVGAVIYQRYIPRHKDVVSVEDALYTGEDFELLFTLSAEEGNKLLAIKNRINTPISFIGQIMPKEFGLMIVDNSCRQKKIVQKGFRHF